MSELPPVVERLRAIFAEQFHVELPPGDIDLLESGLLDSLRLVELLLHIEQEFAIRIPIETIELEHLRTLTGLARVVATHRGPALGATLAACRSR